MRSDRVVFPESMCAEMPMLRMRSMFATSVSALLDVSLEQASREREFPRAPPKRGRAPYPEKGRKGKPAALRPFRRYAAWRPAETIRCRRALQVAPRCAASAVARLTRADDADRGAAAYRHPPGRHAEERLPLEESEQAGPRSPGGAQ